MSRFFEIHDEDFGPLKDKVVIVTGCASGIGLATTKLLLAHGAKVVGADLKTPPITHANLTFQQTNVSSWTDLTKLFTTATQAYGGRIDHVFANAGIVNEDTFLDLQVDPSTGQLAEPSHKCFDINLKAVVNTGVLAAHYMKTQLPPGGSVVVTSSASAFQRFSAVDYASAKHGVLGFMRGMMAAMKTANLPIRFNAIAPSWTYTGMVPPGFAEKAGSQGQTPEVVAPAAAVLMADKDRNGHFIYITAGKNIEIDENLLLKVARDQITDGVDDDQVYNEIHRMVKELQAQSAN